jgi:hypothetical protein
MDGVGRSVSARGSSRTTCWGLPLATILLGDAALPSCRWSRVQLAAAVDPRAISIEWARTRHVSLAGFAVTVKNVATNPVVGSILIGTAWGGWAFHCRRWRIGRSS